MWLILEGTSLDLVFSGLSYQLLGGQVDLSKSTGRLIEEVRQHLRRFGMCCPLSSSPVGRSATFGPRGF